MFVLTAERNQPWVRSLIGAELFQLCKVLRVFVQRGATRVRDGRARVC